MRKIDIDGETFELNGKPIDPSRVTVPPAVGWCSCAKVTAKAIADLLPYLLPGKSGDGAIEKARKVGVRIEWRTPLRVPNEGLASAAVDWLFAALEAGDALRLLLARCSLPEDTSGQAAVAKARQTLDWLVDQMAMMAPELIDGREFKIERETLLEDSPYVICAKGTATNLLTAGRCWSERSRIVPARFDSQFEALTFILKGATR